VNSSNLLDTNLKNTLSSSPWIGVSYGLAPNLDIWTFGALSSVIVRYDFTAGKNLFIGGLGVDASSITPRIDIFKSYNDKFFLEVNFNASVPFTDAGKTTLNFDVCPAFNLSKVVYGYVEILPAYSLDKDVGFNLDISPGINLVSEKGFGFAFGPRIGGLSQKKQTLSIETMWWYSFGVK
jgi:hypothetical protein